MRITPVLITRRHLQVGLGLVWLIDAALQFQPYMFSHGFGRDIIRAAAQGQPEVVAAAVRLAARLIGVAPVYANTAFALVQLALALGLLRRRWARLALRGTVVWSLGVWYFGEAMGGVFSGHASLLSGAPGAAFLYLLVAAAAWVRSEDDMDRPVSDRVLVGWAVVWGVGALLQALPGQASGRAMAGVLSSAGQAGPSWLAAADQAAGRWLGDAGPAAVAVVIVVEILVGVAVFLGPVAARRAAVSGAVVAVAFWVLGEGFGLIYTGQGTDPNSGPLLVLLAAAVCSWARSGATAAASRPRGSRPHAGTEISTQTPAETEGLTAAV